MFRIIVFVLFFIGCGIKTKPIYVAFNTPKLKIADQGFLKEGFGYREIVIYKAGVEPIKITLKSNEICLNFKCVNKKAFIKSLDKGYPYDLLDRILEKKPLWFGKIIKIKDGFLQKDDRFFYKVTKDKVVFKDRAKKIVVLIKFL